jgi:membrane-bound metal-dependent hydrolase YbcI (DUF457 family)
MNYIHHALIGVGTGCLGVIAAESLGVGHPAPVALGIGAIVAAAGAIATDLDHPRSFISHSIPSRIIRIALAVLAIPVLAALAVLFTSHDIPGTWSQFSALIFGWNIMRWSLFALVLSLGLITLSWILYKNLHHRGPLHSLIFALAITITACVVFYVVKQSWTWGLVFGWGWLWHILADGLTTEGVPFFWPINDERMHTLPAWICKAAAWLLSLSSMGGIVMMLYIQISPLFI